MWMASGAGGRDGAGVVCSATGVPGGDDCINPGEDDTRAKVVPAGSPGVMGAEMGVPLSSGINGASGPCKIISYGPMRNTEPTVSGVGSSGRKRCSFSHVPLTPPRSTTSQPSEVAWRRVW